MKVKGSRNFTVAEVTSLFIHNGRDRKVKESTIEFYQAGLRCLVELFGEVKCKKLEPSCYDQFLHKANHRENGEKMAPNTIRRNMGTFKMWQAFAISIGALKEPLVLHFIMPAGRRREFLPNAGDVQAIVPHFSPQFHLIWQSLRQCGARPSELCGARVEHWDRRTRAILLTEHKGDRTGKIRRIDVGSKMEALILDSLGGRTEGHLFLDENGKPWTRDKLSYRFRTARNKAGLSKKWVNYTTRREFGTGVYRSKDALTAAELLGHSNLSSIHHYAIVDTDKKCSTQDELELVG